MTYKTILVHAEAGETSAPRLECAAAIARDFEALLVGVGAELVDVLGAGDPYGFAERPWVATLREHVDTELRAAEAAFLRIAETQRHEWRLMQDVPTSAMARAARAADLIVAGGTPSLSGDPYQTVDIGKLALVAGRPILVVPAGGGQLHGRSIIIAWKDTREARRAMADALPFLRKADDVLVLAVCAESETGLAEAQTSDVAAALGRHGVKATAKVVPGFDDEICGQIETEANARSADLIVAGAYGRHRFTEWVFGGVTRKLLQDPTRFLLLSH